MCNYDKGSHLAPAHAHPGVYFYSLLLSAETHQQRRKNGAAQSHNCSSLWDATSNLFHSTELLIPCHIPPTCFQDGLPQWVLPVGCLRKSLCALCCAHYFQLHCLSLPAPSQQGLPYAQPLHSIAVEPRNKILSSFQGGPSCCTYKRYSKLNFWNSWPVCICDTIFRSSLMSVLMAEAKQKTGNVDIIQFLFRKKSRSRSILKDVLRQPLAEVHPFSSRYFQAVTPVYLKICLNMIIIIFKS